MGEVGWRLEFMSEGYMEEKYKERQVSESEEKIMFVGDVKEASLVLG